VPTNTVPLGTIPPVTRIRYIVNGDVGAGPSSETWRATVDLSGVDPATGSSYQTVSVTSADPRFIVIDFEPRTVNVQLDPYTSYQVPVQVNTGTTPEGFDLGPVEKTPDTVTVSGPVCEVRRRRRRRRDHRPARPLRHGDARDPSTTRAMSSAGQREPEDGPRVDRRDQQRRRRPCS
jgi:hypothetical protein